MNDAIHFLLSCLYLAVPGIFANMAPVFFKNMFKPLAVPVDLGKTWRGKPIFGKNKTFRGFVVGIASAIPGIALQTYLYRFPTFESLSFIPYDEINFVLLGFLMGFGVLFGDLMESFVKRRLGLKPGAKFFPWDQLDHLTGAFIFISLVWMPPWSVVLTMVVLAVGLSVLFKHLGYWLGIDKSKW